MTKNEVAEEFGKAISRYDGTSSFLVAYRTNTVEQAERLYNAFSKFLDDYDEYTERTFLCFKTVEDLKKFQEAAHYSMLDCLTVYY